jgi:hypothetical protein
LRLKCNDPLSNFAFNFNLRLYILDAVNRKISMDALMAFARDPFNTAGGY